MPEQTPESAKEKQYLLRVQCLDRPGIVAAVSGFLHAQGTNIEDAAQYHDKSAESGRFFMRIICSGGDPATIRLGFADIAAQYKMAWRFDPYPQAVPALILVSKADHCLADLLYRARTNHLNLDIRAVASNHDMCRPLVEREDIPFHYFAIGDGGKETQEQQVRTLIEDHEIELIVMARYMQVLSDRFCRDYEGRVINIHHSFLPGFKGARPYHQAHERGVKLIGATAHFATADLDEGPIIEQETTRVSHAVTAAEMQAIGQDTESRVLARAVRAYTERRIFMNGQRTVIL